MATHTFVNINGTHLVDVVELFTDHGDRDFADIRLSDGTVVTVFAEMVFDNQDLFPATCDACLKGRECHDMQQYGNICLPCYREFMLSMDED